MVRKRPISTIMTHQVISLNIDDTLEKAKHLFKIHNIRHIPVVSRDALLGIISYTDLLRINFDDAFEEKGDTREAMVDNLLTIGQVMTRKIVSVNTSNTIKEVAEIFKKQPFHALPVVDDNKLVGIVTTTDLINYLLNKF
ncbi:CBS domain-containing protein [Postechiella marina]|uniref:CBS domain-containing protein n=1 Tax=Postechiella marina TaxID=943941 RepID=A0ABP8CE79_9FLAO